MNMKVVESKARAIIAAALAAQVERIKGGS
jgi:hypothetical protein